MRVFNAASKHMLRGVTQRHADYTSSLINGTVPYSGAVDDNALRSSNFCGLVSTLKTYGEPWECALFDADDTQYQFYGPSLHKFG